MDDRRVLTLSVLLLALGVSLDVRPSMINAVLPESWKPKFLPLSCSPDLPPDCIILWGP